MADGRPFPTFDSASQQWENWREKFQSYLHTKYVRNPERKLSYLKYLGGDEILYLLKNARARSEESEGQDVYSMAIDLLNDHFKTTDNPFVEIEKFRAMKQHSSEPAKSFVVRLRQQAMKCRFNEMEEEVRRQFVLGNMDEKVKAKAFRKELELNELIKEATANESLLQSKRSVDINFVRERNTNQFRRQPVCWFCRQTGHLIRSCPGVKAHVCNICGKRGHTERRCYSQKQAPRGKPYSNNKKPSTVNWLLEDFPAEGGDVGGPGQEAEYVFFLEGQDETDCVVGGVKIRMMIDS